MRGALLVAIGVAAGWLLRGAVAPAPAHPQRRVVSESRAPVAAEAPAEPSPAPDPSPAPAVRAAPAEPPIHAVPPSAGAARPAGEEDELESGYGRIVLPFPDSDEPPEVFLSAPGAFGGVDQFEVENREGHSCSIDVRPGAHLLWWRKPGGRRLGLRVEVEPGAVVTVDPAGATDLPPPEGCGRIDVLVAGAGGLPVEDAQVRLALDSVVPTEPLEEWSDGTGRCRFEVRPGSHTIRIGAWSRAVQVLAGECVEVLFRPVEHGTLSVEAPVRSVVAIGPDGATIHADVQDSPRHSFLALVPGAYELRAVVGAEWTDLRPLGRFEVLAGRETTTTARLPGGSLQVEVLGKAQLVQVELRPNERLPLGVNLEASKPDAAAPRFVIAFQHLPPGEYELVVRSWDLVGPLHYDQRRLGRTVSVGDGPASVSIVLPP